MKGRLLLFPLCALLALVSARDAAFAYWYAGSPAKLPGPLEGVPQLAVQQADRDLLRNRPSGLVREELQGHAMAALASAPLDAAAMRQLGMASAWRGGGEGQKHLILAEHISRRDLLDQLLLIDAGASAGDLANTLVHYDRALSVHPEAGKVLFPVLASAIAEDPIAVELVHHADRPWFRGLIGAAVDAGAGSSAVTPLLSAAGAHWPAEDLAPLYTRLLGKLVSEGHYDEAQALVARIPGVSSGALSRIGFSAATSDPRLAPLSWTLASSNVARGRAAGDGSLAIHMASERSAVVAERITLLSPGTYQVTQRLTYEAGSPHARLAWDIRCLDNDAAPVWQQPIPDRDGEVTYRSAITIPPTCPAQRWRLTATSDATQMESTARLDWIEQASR